jgi:RNA polymerase sigma-70 factor, ECF subfamily
LLPASKRLADQQDLRSDHELIAAANAGNAGAFEALYFRYREWVTSLAYRLTGDHALALDVLQETFLYFLQKFPGFVLTCQLKSFLYPAVRNLSIAARRKAQRAQGDAAVPEEIEAPDVPQAFNNEIDAVIGQLGVEHREVLLLRFVDGLTVPDIAVALDIPEGTVKSRLHNAIAKLRSDERTKQFFDR